jgi:DNA topoisomerase-3
VPKNAPRKAVEPETAPGKPEKTETFGICPRCGGDVIEGQKGFGCSNWRKKDGACRFIIWKTIAGKTIAKSTVRQILAKGVSDRIEGFKSGKTGKDFAARLRVNDDKDGEYAVVFDFS